jgi:hypothetical protein
MHDLANDGYLRLKAIDYSQAAIDLQKANHGGLQRSQNWLEKSATMITLFGQ